MRNVLLVRYGEVFLKGANRPHFLKVLNDNVKKVNIFNNLVAHNDEYIYFRTDHHWTALGAYYAYEVLYARDYTPEEAQRFCDAVKPIAREYFADLYYSDLFEEAACAGANLDTAAMLAAIEAHLPLVDESLSEPWAYMPPGGMTAPIPWGCRTTAHRSYSCPARAAAMILSP